MMRDIKIILNTMNPWWQSKTTYPNVPSGERELVRSLLKTSINKAIILIGPRQSGKTTVILQTIKHLLQHIEPLNIVYAPMDVFRDASIYDVIKAHQELTAKTENIYYFFDEIHYDKNWSINLKTLIDKGDRNFYYATGSSSTLLLRNSTESGLGRFIFKYIPPLSFREYLILQGIKPRITFTLEEITYKIKDNEILLYSEIERLKPFFQRYLLWGGFPEYLSKNYEIQSWQNILRQNYVSLTIYKDVLSKYEVRDPAILEDLLYLINEKTTLPVSYDSIAKSFQLKIETIRKYVGYLETAGLIITAEYYTKNILKRVRRNKKFYLIDPGFNTALSYETILSDSLTSKNVELTVATTLIKYMKEKTGLLKPRLFYWKNKFEIDFIVEFADKIIPIEVKYTNNIKQNDLMGLLEFMREFKVKRGIVVTKNTLEIRNIDGKEIYLIPAVVLLAGII